MKKFVAMLLALSMVFIFTACAKTETAPETTVAPTVAQTEAPVVETEAAETEEKTETPKRTKKAVKTEE